MQTLKAIVVGLLVTIGGLVGLIVLGAVLMTVFRIDGKSSAPNAQVRPRQTGAPATPIPQFESHTCGLLSLSTAYVKYGLSPEGENLRFRLGVDRAANPADSGTTGTLHPDMLRVLVQDGFSYELIDPEAWGGAARLRKHVSGGDAALLLIARRENGALHWVMTDGVSDEGLRVVDSLKPAPVTEPVDDFMSACVLSIIAIKPGGEGDEESIGAAHSEGLSEMVRVRERMQRRR